MDAEGIREFFNELLDRHVSFKREGHWLMTSCPLAPWTHDRGTDSSPSFGVTVEDDEVSVFHCFTCHKKGPLSHLIRLMERYTGEDYGPLKRALKGGEAYGYPLPSYEAAKGRRKARKGRETLPEPPDEMLLDLYDSAAGHPYLAERKITDETAEQLGLLHDPGDYSGAERILFPVYTHDGIFYGITGRAVDRDVELRVKDYHGLPKRLLLLGSERIDRDHDKHVVLVEGLFDYAWVRQCGEPAVASMHANLTEAQVRILQHIGLPVVVFYDNDGPGREATDIVIEKLRGSVPVMRVKYPDTMVKRVRFRRKGKGRKVRLISREPKYKDPAALPEEGVKYMIEHADLG